MTKLMKVVPVIILALGLALTGCQKKTTKVQPEPEPTPPAIEEPTPPPPEPVVEEDIEGKLREILQPIYFAFDQYDLNPAAISKLETIARFLQDHPSVRLMSEGHADERGSNEYNISLGENRARAVKNYLTSYGITSDRIEITSYGEERPVSANCGEDDSCHEKNRRAEWQILAR